MSLDGYLSAQLNALKSSGLFRDPAEAYLRQGVAEAARALGVPFIDASSNDYLGWAQRVSSVSRETLRGPAPTSDISGALADTGVSMSEKQASWGAAASRLVHGTRSEHEALEAELARWVGTPSSLLFTSGFAANLGAVSALVGKPFGVDLGGNGAAVVSDALNHASLVDGMRLARADVMVVPHRNVAAVEAALAGSRGAATRWVVTESYFSMDGDTPNLPALRALCDRYRAFLVVDEAHALGVFGPEGAGLCSQSKVRPDVLIGTFGKALGTQGAFVAGSEVVRTFLWNRARSFVFSTAMSPELAAHTQDNLGRTRAAEAQRRSLHARCARFRERLEQRQIAVVRDSMGPIVPVLAGSNERAVALAQRLREQGILAQPIRSPTVPAGFERVRITITAAFSDADVERLADALDSAWQSTTL